MSVILVFVALIAGLLVALIGFAPDALGQEHNQMSLVYYLCWLIVMGSAIFATLRNNWLEAVRNGVIWLLLLLALVAGYSVRHDLADFGRGMVASLVPGLAIPGSPGEVSLRQAQDGHFYVWAQANRQDIRFVVDTGASMVVLRAEDARKLAIDFDDLSFSMPVSTANGNTTAAPIQLSQLSVGEIVMRDIEAVVMRPGQVSTSLLGMTFLGRLSAYSFAGDELVMRR